MKKYDKIETKEEKEAGEWACQGSVTSVTLPASLHDMLAT